jgi:hypothetical protein
MLRCAQLMGAYINCGPAFFGVEFRILTVCIKNKSTLLRCFCFSGERGIRTHGRLITYGCFQDSCNQPLCHLSGGKYNRVGETSQIRMHLLRNCPYAYGLKASNSNIFGSLYFILFAEIGRKKGQSIFRSCFNSVIS